MFVVTSFLQLIDLHRCKSEDLSDELTTYALNESEIEACRRVSIGPTFIVRFQLVIQVSRSECERF